MNLEVPIVATANAAIPETLGGAGLLLLPDAKPTLVAEALSEVITNVSTRDQLIARGRSRAQELVDGYSEAQYVAAIMDACV